MNQLKLFEGFKVQRSIVALDKPEEVDLIDEEGQQFALGYGDVVTVEYRVRIGKIEHGAKGDDTGHEIDDFARKHVGKTLAGSTRIVGITAKAEHDAEWEAQRPQAVSDVA